MKGYFQYKRNRTSFNLIIVGAGFVNVMLIMFYMLHYNNRLEEEKTLSYNELKQTYPIIAGEETYEFMSTILDTPSFEMDTLLDNKIVCFSIGHTRNLRRFISALPDTVLSGKEKKFIKSQFSSESLLWDNSKLKFCRMLTPQDLCHINRSDTTEYWEEFERLFGYGGYNKYSNPVFNSDSTIAIVEHTAQSGLFSGIGRVLLFKKVKGKWILFRERNLWIS